MGVAFDGCVYVTVGASVYHEPPRVGREPDMLVSVSGDGSLFAVGEDETIRLCKVDGANRSNSSRTRQDGGDGPVKVLGKHHWSRTCGTIAKKATYLIPKMRQRGFPTCLRARDESERERLAEIGGSGSAASRTRSSSTLTSMDLSQTSDVATDSFFGISLASDLPFF